MATSPLMRYKSMNKFLMIQKRIPTFRDTCIVSILTTKINQLRELCNDILNDIPFDNFIDGCGKCSLHKLCDKCHSYNVKHSMQFVRIKEAFVFVNMIKNDLSSELFDPAILQEILDRAREFNVVGRALYNRNTNAKYNVNNLMLEFATYLDSAIMIMINSLQRYLQQFVN